MFTRPFSFVPVILALCVTRATVPTVAAAPGPPSTDPACAYPPTDQCAFYADCLESRYHCGPNGYPLGYGHHYCQKFSDNRTLFDAHGQQWMVDTMRCLQLALVGDAVGAVPTTCQALEERAFASHARCYTSNGFCTLGVHDWVAVLEIVDLFSGWDVFKAVVQTASECGGYYARMVAAARLF